MIDTQIKFLVNIRTFIYKLPKTGVEKERSK